MRRTSPGMLAGAALVAMPLLFAACPSLAGCGADAGEVDASCYNGDLHAALHDALASDRPLLLPRGTYSLNQPLVIDYAAHAGTGFQIISRGAIVDGTAIRSGPVLEIICSGGSRPIPADASTSTRKALFSSTPIRRTGPSDSDWTISPMRTIRQRSIT